MSTCRGQRDNKPSLGRSRNMAVPATAAGRDKLPPYCTQQAYHALRCHANVISWTMLTLQDWISVALQVHYWRGGYQGVWIRVIGNTQHGGFCNSTPGWHPTPNAGQAMKSTALLFYSLKKRFEKLTPDFMTKWIFEKWTLDTRSFSRPLYFCFIKY